MCLAPRALQVVTETLPAPRDSTASFLQLQQECRAALLVLWSFSRKTLRPFSMQIINTIILHASRSIGLSPKRAQLLPAVCQLWHQGTTCCDWQETAADARMSFKSSLGSEAGFFGMDPRVLRGSAGDQDVHKTLLAWSWSEGMRHLPKHVANP